MIRLADTPTPHVTQVAQSVLGLLRSKGARNDMYGSIPADQPNPASTSEPVDIKSTGHGIISHADWDELYHAIQVRLENCVNDALDKAPQLALDKRIAATKIAVTECVDAMRQLHAALILERQDRQDQPKN
jgi:hypothetical protein